MEWHPVAFLTVVVGNFTAEEKRAQISDLLAHPERALELLPLESRVSSCYLLRLSY